MKTGIVPDKKHVKMRYFFKADMDISTVLRQHNIRANGLFDPDQTGTGHQPRGFDQWSNFYDNYVVTSSRITIHGFSVDNSHPWLLAVRAVKGTGTADSDDADIVEMPGSSFSLKSAYRDSHKRITSSVNVAKFYNRVNIADDTDLIGTFGTDPSEELYFTILADGVGTNASGTIRVVGWIDYSVMLLNPKKVSSS